MTLHRPNLNLRDWFCVIGIWFSAIAGLMADSVNKIALYIVLPIVFVLTFLYNKSLLTNRYMNLLSMLFIWILLSVLWATSIDYAMVQVNQILGSFLLCFVFSALGNNNKLLPLLYLSFILLLLSDWYYAYNNMLDIEFGVDRLNDLKLNANTFAYHTFYATFSIFILGEYSIGIKRIVRILFLLMMPLSFVTALYTGSRQLLIVQVPLILMLLFGRYFKYVSLQKRVIALFLVFIAIIAISPKLLRVYNNSMLKERTELSLQEDSRVMLFKDALKVGNDHFPLGVGANNYIVYSYNHHFSHNTYLELYANEGIIGLFIYLYLMLLFLKTQWRRYRKTRDIMYYYFFTAGLIFAIDGFFYVFYSHLWLISFFILISTHSETYYKKLR